MFRIQQFLFSNSNYRKVELSLMKERHKSRSSFNHEVSNNSRSFENDIDSRIQLQSIPEVDPDFKYSPPILNFTSLQEAEAYQESMIEPLNSDAFNNSEFNSRLSPDNKDGKTSVSLALDYHRDLLNELESDYSNYPTISQCTSYNKGAYDSIDDLPVPTKEYQRVHYNFKYYMSYYIHQGIFTPGDSSFVYNALYCTDRHTDIPGYNECLRQPLVFYTPNNTIPLVALVVSKQLLTHPGTFLGISNSYVSLPLDNFMHNHQPFQTTSKLIGEEIIETPDNLFELLETELPSEIVHNSDGFQCGHGTTEC